MATEVTQVVAENLLRLGFAYFPAKPWWGKPELGDEASLHLKISNQFLKIWRFFPHWETASSNSPNTFIEPGQINPWQEVGVAGNPRVDLVVGEDHGVHLDVLDLVGVVADHTGELHPPDLIQLEGKCLWVKTVCSSWHKKVENWSNLCLHSAGAIHLGPKVMLAVFWGGIELLSNMSRSRPAQEWRRKASPHSRTRSGRPVGSCGTASRWCTPGWDRPWKTLQFLLHCRWMKLTIEPGRGRSVTPALQRSRSSGLS